jgi:hypothetical protein
MKNFTRKNNTLCKALPEATFHRKLAQFYPPPGYTGLQILAALARNSIN